MSITNGPIGQPERVVEVTPLEEPVPRKITCPDSPADLPAAVPDSPEGLPEREPERVS